MSLSSETYYEDEATPGPYVTLKGMRQLIALDELRRCIPKTPAGGLGGSQTTGFCV